MENRSHNLAPAIRASLNAKLDELLRRPLIAALPGSRPTTPDLEVQVTFGDEFLRLTQQLAPKRAAGPSAWTEDKEAGTWILKVQIDYDHTWRGGEREVETRVNGCVEEQVTFLTEEQRRLLQDSPRAFLEFQPRPVTAELVDFRMERVGGSDRVVALVFAEPPEGSEHLRHVAIVPNLIPLERQLLGLWEVERASSGGSLQPLKALLGVGDLAENGGTAPESIEPTGCDRLDSYQKDCVRLALSTPHFAVIHGPPGSGKTTAIASIIREELERGGRILVVSPTNVAVDNVVEKLVGGIAPRRADGFEAHTLPTRIAARPSKLTDGARAYWVGKKRQLRGAALARRVQAQLQESSPIARALYAVEDTRKPGRAPLTGVIAAFDRLLCGTPIGLLSSDTVKALPAGGADLLIVDEVSKLTLPEFLAIAVKARRWVVVGDPQQLPPFSDCVENAVTLTDVLPPELELVCSVGAVLERVKPTLRRDQRLLVVATRPELVSEAIRAHLDTVFEGRDLPRVSLVEERRAGVVVCRPDQVDDGVALLSPAREYDRRSNENGCTVPVLVERGQRAPSTAQSNGLRMVEARERAAAILFDTTHGTYHAQPWSNRAAQRIQPVSFRNGLAKSLPSAVALERLGLAGADSPDEVRARIVAQIAERYAVNAVSLYDWLTGMPVAEFDVSPLLELGQFQRTELIAAVRPYVGMLRKQYRMHPSLSRVPRELFYFGEALHDGHAGTGGSKVKLLQVEARAEEGETNTAERDVIVELVTALGRGATRNRPVRLMVVTPYRKQEALLQRALEELVTRAGFGDLETEVCTFDRCQGREAEYVFLSLVRSRSTPFFDNPKRWNVALTRAKEGLFIVGNIDAYLYEAGGARRHPLSMQKPDGTPGKPQMSLLARIVEAYHHQNAATGELH